MLGVANGVRGASRLRAARRAAVGAGALLLGACALVQQNYTAEVERTLQQAAAERDALRVELSRREAAERAREAVFQAYVASTQRHAQSENARLIAGLFDIGLDPAEAIVAVTEPQAAAGGIDRNLGLEADGYAGAADVDANEIFGGEDSFASAANEIQGDFGGETLPASEGTDSVLGLNNDLRAFVAAIPAVVPVREAHVTSGFGVRRHPISRRLGAHEGTDFVSVTDRSVIAAGDGVVRFAGRSGGYGKLVIVEHPLGFETHYAHLARIDVVPGQAVAAAEPLGVMGNTGYSTGVHLHFELRFRGRPLDPDKAFAMANPSAEIHRLR
jgi:murein DD-endopeptidase MepM/ murein hydrolase activator NlpD